MYRHGTDSLVIEITTSVESSTIPDSAVECSVQCASDGCPASVAGKVHSPAEPPRGGPARGLPLNDRDQTPTFNLTDPAPVLEFEFDRNVPR